MKKRLILIGKAASGKDYLQKRLVDEGWIPLRQYTTRPKRPTEVGDEYHFVTEEEFDNISHKLVSVQNFNGWKYGFDMDEALKSDVMIFSPANFFNMVYNFDIKNLELSISSTVIYLDIDEYTRRERLSVRYVGGSEDDSLERRLRADADDFEFFDSIDGDEYQKNIQVPCVNLPKFVRLHNKEEVDDFLEKLLS